MAQDTQKDARQERTSRLALVFVTTLGAQFIAGLLPLPYVYVALPIAVACVVIGIVLFVMSITSDGILLTMLTIFGVVSSGFFALQLTGTAIVHGPSEALQECNARAITASAERACAAQYEADIVEAAEAWPDQYRDLLIAQFGIDEPNPSPTPSPSVSPEESPAASPSPTDEA